jgi:hypothetical protein
VDITRWHFGEYTSLSPAKSGPDMFVWYQRKHWILDAPLREGPPDGYTYSLPPSDPGPIERADFGERDRLHWPGGGCTIAQTAKPMFWGARYALWFETSAIFVLDTVRASVARLVVPNVFEQLSEPFIHGGKLWLRNWTAVVSIAQSFLEGLCDRTPGSLEIRVVDNYPVRRPKRVEKVRITAVSSDTVHALTPNGEHSLSFPFVDGVAVGLDVTVYDELAHNVFLEIELPGQPRRRMREPPASEGAIAAWLEVEPAVDPLATHATRGEAPARQVDLDRLFGERADTPDEPMLASVIVDMLEDAGEPFAPLFAQLVAGETANEVRVLALGGLANFLDEIAYRDGLPWSAQLARMPPLDPDLIAAIRNDQRLGMLHTLRVGGGPFAVYAKLVGAPRAVGLRHIDVPNAQVLAELIAADRRELRRLSNVKFATRAVLEGLAHPTFDRVEIIDFPTSAKIVAKQLEFVIRDELAFFGRVPRHLVLSEHDGHDLALLDPVLAAWHRLPLDKVTVAGITLARDGTASVAPEAPQAAIGRVRGRFKIAG